MKKLKKIIEQAKTNDNNNFILKELEIYVAQKESIILIEKHDEYVRVLPKNSMYYIDILDDTSSTFDERNYIVLKELFDRDLLKYIKTICIHEGCIRLNIRDDYSLAEVQNIFNKHSEYSLKIINNKMDVFSGDLYYFEFYDKVNEVYIT